MKKLLLTTAAIGLLGVSAFGQGLVAFANSTATPISFGTEVKAGDTAGAFLPSGTRFSVELLYNPGTDPAQDPGDAGMLGRMMGNPVPIANIPSNAGRYNGGTRMTPTSTAPGARAWFQVVAWETAFGTSYDEAAANPNAYRGRSNRFNIATGAVTPTPISAPGGVMAFAVNVPEPSTVALGILGGLGTMLLLRRRKV